MYIFQPEKFSPEKDVVGYKKLHHEKYCWLVHTIIDASSRRDLEKDEYVNLSSTLLGHYLGEALYTTVRDALIESKVIDWRDSYSKGNFSTSFRLTKKFADQKIVLNPFDTPRAKSYFTKFAKWVRDRKAEVPKSPVYQQLLKNAEEIEFDFGKALALLNATKPQLTTDQYNRRLIAIQNFALGRRFYSVPGDTGRFFHSVANLPKEYRQFLSFEGKSLVNLDIRNSQPLLFVPLLKENWKSYIEFTDEIFERRNELNPKYGVESNGHIAFPEKLFKAERPTIKLPDDIQMYIDLTEKGEFYDEFIKYLKGKGIKKIPDRDIFKKDFFKRVFFSTQERSVTYRYEEWFYKWMPNVSKAVDWYKRNNYKALSIQLQKTEADIIINSICAELLQESPIPFFLTIHDSILCYPENATGISKIMMEKYKDNLDLKPTIKVEKL